MKKNSNSECKKIVPISKEKNYCDSCGQATHTNSWLCIKGAMEEFIERQSFIFSYLSKNKCEQIILNDDKFKPMLNIYHDFKFFNISLCDGIYVILGKGIKEEKFIIGLGASNNLDEAIEHCFKEIILCDYMVSNYINKGNGKIKDIYMDKFCNLTSQRLCKAYEYLDESKQIRKYKDMSLYGNSIEKLFRDLNEIYKMNPIIFFIPTIRSVKNLKMVKVYDEHWFSSLDPRHFSEETYRYVEKVTNNKLDRKCSFIPFL